MRILVINPGSTSSKLAVYEEEREIFREHVAYSRETLARFPSIAAQLPMRQKRLQACLRKAKIPMESMDAIAARGGMLPPVKAGAYLVDEALVYALRYQCVGAHSSNLAGIMAKDLSDAYGIPAYIYDAVSVDELLPEARLSGLAGYDRPALTHALNTGAVCRLHAERIARPYASLKLIAAHLGGGSSVTLRQGGRMIDMVAGHEGAFSTERTGGMDVLLVHQVAKERGLAFLQKTQSGQGGLVSYLGSNDARQVQAQIDAGDRFAKTCKEAMALQVSKAIVSLAATVDGAVDGILITGGLAHWRPLLKAIEKRVRFVAPVHAYPGEYEMAALAAGVLRVLRGEEPAQRFGTV